MGKYAEALGVWEHKIEVGGKVIAHDLKPKKGDNLRIAKIMGSADESKNSDALFSGMIRFYVDLVKRDYPELSAKDVEELEAFVEMNIMQIMKDVLVAFRWTTKDNLQKFEDEQLKKVGLQAKKES